jgi:pimeloyl-ACP methyl ester carboxylesterase
LKTSVPYSSHFSANKVRLAVHDFGGTGDAGTALLAHPTGFHGYVWAPVAERLVAAGWKVWSFDFRGHGDSDKSPDGYDWHGFADDVLAVVGDLGLTGDRRLLAAGHSKGAAALILAEQRVPGTFARLWCYEPIIFPSDDPLPPNPEFPLATAARKRRAVWPSRDAARASYASKPPLEVLHPDALDAYVEYGLRDVDDGTVVLKCAPEDEAAVYTMGSVHGAYPRLGEVACPVVVACGEHTDAIVPKLAAMIAERLPRGQVEVMPGLGHFGPMEDPDAIVASMLRFAAETT